MKYFLVNLNIFLILGFFISCMPAVHILNPIIVGHVEPNRVVKRKNYHHPELGILDDEASLLALDNHWACFHVKWNLLDGDDGNAIKNINAVLEIVPGGTKIENPQVMDYQSDTQYAEGKVLRTIQTGINEYCTQPLVECVINAAGFQQCAPVGCRRYEQEPIYKNVYMSEDFLVVSNLAKFCFSHDGAVSTSTEKIVLKLSKNRRTFLKVGWKF
jgi:hypothetical protein